MSFCLFIIHHDGPAFQPSAAAWDNLARLLKSIPALTKAHLYTPDQASDPFLNDGPPPPFALQLYFPTLPALEAAAAHDGPLQRLVGDQALLSLAGASVSQQAMLVRDFAVPDPTLRHAPHCTYLVGYEGPAEDLNAWHGHYLAHHPPIMATMPGLRELEIYTRVDWVSFLPWKRDDLMQRNKVAFDDAAALTAALNSPVRQAMRADYNKFPPFAGKTTHFPMTTRVLRP